MTAIITTPFRIKTAQRIIDYLNNDYSENTPSVYTLQGKNLYLFIGRTLPWSNENSPDTPVDTISSIYDDWDSMIAIKRIASTGAAHVVPLFNWTSGTRYIAYDPTDQFMYQHPTPSEQTAAQIAGNYIAGSMYTVNTNFDVYKCLGNFNNANSTVMPTGQSTSAFTTSDGYIWRYLYTVSASDSLNFLTTDWLPVRVLASNDGSNQWLVQAAAIDGAVEAFSVDSAGSGYVNTLAGCSVVSATSSTVVLGSAASGTSSIYNGATIYITSGTGSGQSAVISTYVVGGSKTVSIVGTWSVNPDATSVVSILPTIQITNGDGTGLVGKAVVVGGVISQVLVTTPGSGYHHAIVTVVGCGGTGAIVRALFSPPGGYGSNAIYELGGFFTMINVTLAFNEGSGVFPVSTSYRRMGILADVLDNTSTTATQTTYRATKTLTLSSVSGNFLPNETITSNHSGTPTATAIEYDSLTSNTGTLSFFQTSSTGFLSFNASDIITGSSSGATATVSSVNANPLQKFSGTIIFVENRRPVVRSIDQSESIKMIVEC